MYPSSIIIFGLLFVGVVQAIEYKIVTKLGDIERSTVGTLDLQIEDTDGKSQWVKLDDFPSPLSTDSPRIDSEITLTVTRDLNVEINEINSTHFKWWSLYWGSPALYLQKITMTSMNSNESVSFCFPPYKNYWYGAEYESTAIASGRTYSLKKC